MPTVREYEQALERNPADTEAFVALRKFYRQAGKHDRLVVLYETRAQAIDDGPKAAELFYLAAELRLDQLNDPSGAEADLANAVHRDSGHVKAARRLKDVYREQGKTGDYMAMLELEAIAISKSHDPTGLAELQAEMNQLFANHFARLERAVRNPQRPGRLTVEHIKTIDTARKIYRALGDYRSVVRLLELELEATADAKRRGDLLVALARVLAEKLGELDAAAQRLSEVIRLRPRDEKALEILAAVYANPNWIGADGLERAAAIYYQIARRRHEAGDPDNAVVVLRKALQALPGHGESSELLERVYHDTRRFQDLDRYYRERISQAESPQERTEFLFKRAQLAEGPLRDRAEAQRVYQEMLALEPPGGPASQHLAELYLESHDYAKLAELRERQLEVIGEPGPRIQIMKELASLYRDRLGDRDQAAVYLHAILQIDPGHPEALAGYAEHFREKGDWKALVDLLEFSFEHARARGVSTPDLIRRLEEIATLSEKNLGDAERSLLAWQRIEELTPGSDRAREAQKRILLRGKQWDRMVAVLEREAQAAQEPAQRTDIQRRIAQILREKMNEPARAVAVYQEILQRDPHDAVALRALMDIFQSEGDWSGLAQTIRHQLDGAANKAERVSLLRRLLALYDEKLGDLPEASWAATEVLKAVPGDRDALSRLESVLQRSNDPRRLVQTLDYHLRYAATTDEKQQLVRRIAELLQNTLGDLPAAAERWEELVRIAPDDGEALEALSQLYGELNRPADSARVLDMQIERVAGDPSAKAEYLRRLAKLAEGPLAEPRRAQRAWETLSELLPADTEALDALHRIYSSKGDWSTLVRILERQIPLAGDPKRAVALALERARIQEDRLSDAVEASRTLEQILRELDPRNVEAHTELRRIYESRGEWAQVVRVADGLMFLIGDPHERGALALEVAAIWRDKLADLRKAVTAYERVLEILPDDETALEALAPLYAGAGDAQRYIAVNEKLLSKADAPADRRRLMLEIAQTCEIELEDARLAFDWLRRAFNEQPEAELLAMLERLSEQFNLREEMIGVHQGIRARARTPFEQLQSSLKIAEICDEKMQDAARAFGVLRDALPEDPTGERLLPELERLAEKTSDWNGLLEVYARVARGRPAVEDRVELLKLRADVRESRMNDASGAMDEFLRSFALQPALEETHDQILRLADVTNRWEDALKIEAQLFAMASDLPSKLQVACRAAALVEEKVRDRVRAFRAYLNAFRLDPENADVVANLWRLAEAIGRYEPHPALDAESARMLAAVGGSALPIEPEPSATEGDSQAATEVPFPAPAGEPSLELSVEDVHEVSDLLEGDDSGTMEVDSGEIILDMISDEKPATPPARASASRATAGRTSPPPLRQVTPPPIIARGAFETPWEEFAQAYESLPANDNATLHGYLMKIAEIWERGQQDIDRTLDALERAFRLDTNDRTVREHLARLGRAQDRWDRVCDIYLGALDELSPIEKAVGLQYDVAQIRESLSQMDRAEERYRKLLELKPDHAPALDRLEELLRNQSRWTDLSLVLEKRLSGPIDGLPPGPARRNHYRELIALYDQRLEKPYEAIDTLERFVSEDVDHASEGPDAAAEMRQAYDDLARLYSRVGLWAKAVDALQHELELGPDDAASRSLRLQIGEINERELGLADRAIEAYQGILAASPNDVTVLSALDRLLESHSRWEELQDILGRRAEQAAGDERLNLIRRRARIIEEKLGNSSEAAACLRALGEEALKDDELAEALIRNLRRSGLEHEAIRLVEERVASLKANDGPETKITALLLRLSDLRMDDLGDIVGARDAIEQALALLPEDPQALSALARLHLKANNFAAYAETRIREARAQRGTPAAITALLEAGRVYREQVSDAPRARSCFEEALAQDSTNSDAMRSLAALHAAEGAWSEAREILLKQLELTSEPAARAAVLTDLARAEWEGASDASEAQRYLDEALTLAPDFLPAVMAVADISYREHQWENAERRLSEALRRLKGQPEQMARLHYRLAEVYDKLGKIDEGYQKLLEADRMSPGQLLVKLSLGENRFRARKWREAAMHLGALADHPDAASYADEVAEALSHGAQSEMKLRRPERALAMYEAALRLRPDHGPSLRAMSDLALERGEKRLAANYLRRLAEGSGDRAERAHVFEHLGNILLDLDEPTQARAAYEGALMLLERPEHDHIALLEKTLKLQRDQDDLASATRTCEMILELIQDEKLRAERRREMAGLLATQGNSARAALLLEQALRENPSDESTVRDLCDVYARTGQDTAAETLLARTLPGLPPPPPGATAARSLRASLWARLGTLLMGKEKAKAIAAFESAVELDPTHTGARQELARLYGDEARFTEAAIRNHRALLEADASRLESLRALGNAYAREGQIDRARCCYDVLTLLGAAEPAEQEFLERHSAPSLAPDDAYASAIEEQDRREKLAHPDALQMAEVFGAIWEAAPTLIKQKVEDLGLSAEDKVSTVSELEVGKIFGQVAKALNNRKTSLYVKWDSGEDNVSLVPQVPPAVVIGPRLANDGSPTTIRFLLGRALELSRPEYILAAALRPKEFAQVFSSVLKAFHPRHARRRTGATDPASEQAAQLKKNLPYKISKRLVELFQGLGGAAFSSAHWRAVVQTTGNRAGLLMCGDLATAARIVLVDSPSINSPAPSAEQFRAAALENEQLKDLLRFAVSEHYFQLRAQLGLAP